LLRCVRHTRDSGDNEACCCCCGGCSGRFERCRGALRGNAGTSKLVGARLRAVCAGRGGARCGRGGSVLVAISQQAATKLTCLCESTRRTQTHTHGLANERTSAVCSFAQRCPARSCSACQNLVCLRVGRKSSGLRRLGYRCRIATDQCVGVCSVKKQ
jgi:hypothetical protein